MRDLDDDYYEFDEKNYRLVGHQVPHRQYCLGDPLRIVIARVDMERRQIDFALEGKSIFIRARPFFKKAKETGQKPFSKRLRPEKSPSETS